MLRLENIAIFNTVSRLILQIISGILAIWLATRLVPGVEVVDSWQTFFLVGLVLGLFNFFLKPILNIITLPLRILTLGLFSIIINMAIVWGVDVLFPELIIPGIIPLFWTTVIVWILSLIFGLYTPRKKVVEE